MNIPVLATFLAFLDLVVVGKGTDDRLSIVTCLPSSLCDEGAKNETEQEICWLCPAEPKIFNEDVIIHCDKLQDVASRRIVFDAIRSYFLPFFVTVGKVMVGADKGYKRIVLVPFDVYDRSNAHEGFSF